MVTGLTTLISKLKGKFSRKKRGIVLPAAPLAHTLIFAHRGSKCNRPENTLASFREAIRVGTDGLELDVHLSKDQELVVIHDEKIDRTTNGKGPVRKFTRAELQSFDAGSWFDPAFAGEKIPTLSEVLALLCDLNFTGTLNIEVKTDHYQYPQIEKRLSQLMISQTWPFTHIYSSFNIHSLAALSALEPQTEISYLMDNQARKVLRGEKSDFITSLHPKKTYAFKHFGQASKPLRLWTVNDEQEMRQAFRENIAGLITDYPEKALRLRNEIQKTV